VIGVGLPALAAARQRGVDENAARVDALLAIMTTLDDTCLLHRAGWPALNAAKRGARSVLATGGSSTPNGRAELDTLERTLLALNASPGGAADLLAATLFIDKLVHHRTGGSPTTWNI
jgi:triphosphoribosyl-dephospho-CoA synthase